MAKVAPRSDLAPEVAHRLSEILSYFGAPHIARRLWNEVLTEDDRLRLGEDQPHLDLPRRYAMLHGCSLERALLDLAMEGSVITVGMHRRLRRQIGESIEQSDIIVRPVWDKNVGTLEYQGVVVRSVRRSATLIRTILDDFQEQGWPARLGNPLPGGADSKKLRDAISTLNKGLDAIKFFADGTATGILWQPK